ncbi:thioredoxin, partial [Microbacteriaceae bacterium K1510]|nr:thioredoxin [Microbacteriaceae bacterium K1510]
SDQTFEQQVLLSPEPVLVNFFAPQRGTWLTMSPVLEQIATEMQGLVKVVRLDVSMNPTVRAQYDIHGLPTLILFNMG